MLRQARFDVSIAEDMEPVVWGKLIINAAINPLTALLRVKNGDLLTNPAARALMNELASETAHGGGSAPGGIAIFGSRTCS